jgi:hypothetical protein
MIIDSKVDILLPTYNVASTFKHRSYLYWSKLIRTFLFIRHDSSVDKTVNYSRISKRFKS